MRITRKIGILVAVPLIAVVVFATFAIALTASEAVQAERLRSLVVTSANSGELAQQLRDERSLAVAAILSIEGQRVDAAKYRSEARTTDKVIESFNEARQNLDSALPDQTKELLGNIYDHLQQLPKHRTDVIEGRHSTTSAAFLYRVIVADIIEFRDSIPQAGGASTELANKLRAATALSRAVESIGLEQVYVTRSAKNGPLTPAAQKAIMQARLGYENARIEFNTLASDEWRAWYEQSQQGNTPQTAQNLEDEVARTSIGDVIDINLRQWNSTMSSRSERILRVQSLVDEELQRDVTKIRDDQQTIAIAQVATVIVVVLIAIVTATRLGRPVVRGLRRLRLAAHQVASEDLPQAVARLDNHEVLGELTPEEFADSIPAPIDVRGRDELAEVGRAFNEVHREAVRVAAQQALLRLHIASIFVNLARRGHALSGRLTEALDEAERTELDPERLERLFGLDHLVTLLSRSNDSLLVLGGTSPAKIRANNEALSDILTASQSQIEQYRRVRINAADVPYAVKAGAVDDVVKLLAELLDNAAQYSRDEVVLDARAEGDGVLVTVTDTGIGIKDERLERINYRLATSAPLDLEAVRSMGLTVVGRIAAWLGVKIRLRRNDPRGTVAEVLLPQRILSTELPTRGSSKLTGAIKPNAPLFQATTDELPAASTIDSGETTQEINTAGIIRPRPTAAVRTGTGEYDTVTPLVSFSWSPKRGATDGRTPTGAPNNSVVASNELPQQQREPTTTEGQGVTGPDTTGGLPKRTPANDTGGLPRRNPTDSGAIPRQTRDETPVDTAATVQLNESVGGLPKRVPMTKLEPGHMEETGRPQEQTVYRDPAAVGATYSAYARGLASNKRQSALFTTEGSRAES